MTDTNTANKIDINGAPKNKLAAAAANRRDVIVDKNHADI